MTRIVVGVDGSPHSVRALRRAMREAELRQGEVDVVYVRPSPQSSMFEGVLDLSESAAGAIRTVTADRAPTSAASRGPRELQTAEQELERFVTQALEGVTGSRPRLVAVLSDKVAEELVEQSRGADLLVIGTRGRGGVAGLLLGSVAHQCIRLGTCPLLILPPTVE